LGRVRRQLIAVRMSYGLVWPVVLQVCGALVVGFLHS
jgi:hypothetical protein